MKKIIILICFVVFVLGLTGCNTAPVISLIPDDAVEYDTLEEALENTLIDTFNLPDRLDGFNTVKYFYCTDKIVAVEYTGKEYSVVFVCVAPSYMGAWSEGIFIPWKRIQGSSSSGSSMGSYSRMVEFAPLTDTRDNYYGLYGLNEDNKGEGIYYSVGFYGNMRNGDFYMYSSKPLDFDTFNDLFFKVIVLNYK